MNSILREMCSREGFQLIYTNNKRIMLSFGRKGNTPRIRIHKMFCNCGFKESRAVIEYAKNNDSKNENLKIIKSYIRLHIKSDNFIIMPPKAIYTEDESIEKNSYTYDNCNIKAYSEFNILMITQRDFWGNLRYAKDAETIRVEDNLVEVDIVVEK